MTELFKTIDLDWYIDGYDGTFYFDCLQTCIAAGAGHFDHNNYYYFLLCSILYDYWEHNPETWISEVLDKMGLTIERYEPINESDLIKTIKERIDNEQSITVTKDSLVRWTPFAGQEPGRLKRESRRISHSLPIRGAKHYLSIDPILR